MTAPASFSPAPFHSELVKAHSYAALITLLVSVLFGILVSLQFIFPDLSGGSLVLGWGRLRYAHTQGIMLGWLGNAFLAFLYHGVPVLTQRSVTSERLGWLLFGLWNFVAVVPGWLLVLAGISQPLEWAEFPFIVDIFVIFALLLAAIQFLPGFFRDGLENIYVSGWYILGGLVFTLLAYPMGNIVPNVVAGAASAAFGGLWIHDAVGLFVTPLALAIIYYIIPASTGRPVFSHFLSMLGFWGLFFFYPLNGTHHYVFSVIPMAAQVGAIAASALLGVVVLIVVSNLLLSMRGSGWIPKDPALRFVGLGVVFYFIVSMQGASQAQMTLNQFVHFTDWVVGHSHLAMMGFATFAGIGGIVHAWQHLPDARYNASAIEWSFWLLSAGITIMVVDLTAAGLIQGSLWQESVPWLESVKASGPWWVIRTLSSIPITAGFIMLGVGMVTGQVGSGVEAGRSSRQSFSVQPETGSERTFETAAGKKAGWLSTAYVITSVAGIGSFAFSMVLLGIWPGRVLDEQIAMTSPDTILTLTASEQRGRSIYAREGCAYCHTQQVRYLAGDIERFGAPTLAWETRYDSPHLWGTRRIGPDLARAGGTRSADWQFAHLFSPRSVTPLSVMPSYSELFDGDASRPTQEARDLVAYIESLGRARAIAWPEGDDRAREAAGEGHHGRMAFVSPLLNAHPGMTRPGGSETPSIAGLTALGNGDQLWLDYCAGCHGVAGRGDGPAAQWLSPRPANLVEHAYTVTYLLDVLWNGVDGTAMPAWRDMPPGDLLALIDLVRSFSADGDNGDALELLSLGEGVYREHCAQCHGDNGAGDGFAARELDVAPASFRSQRPTLGEGLRVLTDGIAGSPMSPWTDRIDDNEMLAVTVYIRAFFNGQEDL